ncbi:hypothetical protein [Nostoc sp.]|uniref:hypothetical protein n=1 Tax=Nostoc sp. TaxID=1180 RepID=UPI00359375BE
MKVRGIKRGQNIEILEQLARLNQLFGAWKNQPELTEIFTEIDQQRHTYQGRTIDSIDN